MTDLAAHAVGYAAGVIMVGAVPARLLLRGWNGPADASAREGAIARLTVLTFGAALLLPVAALLALRAQAAQLVDEGEVLAWPHYLAALESGWGNVWRAQAVAAVFAVLAWMPARGRPFFGTRLAPLAALGVAVTFALAGHPRVVPSGIVLGVLTGALHFIGAGLWLGTLALLAATAWSGTEEGRGDRVKRIIVSFSPVALVGASITGLSGTLLAWQTVGAWSALLTTTYGRTLSLKLLLLTGVAALGAYNWRVLQPRLASGTVTYALRRSALIELGLGAALLAVTATLVTLPAPGIL